jgi:cobalamin biosynthesis protein CbiG
MTKSQTAVPKRQTFVQTERTAHIALGKLAVKYPSAAAVLHSLIGLMDRQCAICISHQTIAEMLGIHLTTVKKAMKILKERNWIQQVQLGPSGTVNAYLVNSRVAWADRRANLRMARFSAVIIANPKDQDEATLSLADMRKVPLIYPPEEALAHGEWPQGEQSQLPGFETVARGFPEDDAPFDPETGELLEIEAD